MSPKAQQIAIAEACGWKDIYRGSRKGTKAINGNTLWGTKDAPSINYPREYSVVPDYLNDLNAIREAEKMLSSKTDNGLGSMGHSNQRGRYEYQLQCVCRSFEIWHATADQRAEAFLRTINKWDPTK